MNQYVVTPKVTGEYRVWDTDDAAWLADTEGVLEFGSEDDAVEYLVSMMSTLDVLDLVTLAGKVAP